MITDQRYDQLLKLANRLRSAYWDAKKYGGNNYREKERLAGAELDRFLKEENKRVQSLQKEILCQLGKK